MTLSSNSRSSGRRAVLRRGRLPIATVVALMIGLVSTALASPPSSAAPARVAAVATLRIPVPNWLASYLVRSRGQDLARRALQAQGYTCLPLGVVCYIEGSYDPPRWGRGTVQTGGSAYYLNARAWPGTDAPIVRTFPSNWRLVIFCQTRGPVVDGRWGPTGIWDYVGQLGDRPMYVSDGFVYTGSNGYVAGDCASTNYGSG